MGSGTLTLNPKEQRALDLLLARCASRNASQGDLVQCAIYKTAAAAKQQAEDADKAALAAAAAVQAAEQRSRDRLMAAGLVYQQITLLQNQAILVLSAMMMAAREYDTILSTQASRPIVGDILWGLAISFAPEFAPITRLIKVLGISKNEAPLLAVGLDRIGVEVQNGKSFTQFLTDRLDARSNNIIKSIRDPVRSQSSMDSASAAKLHASLAMTQMMSETMNRINSRLALAGAVEQAFLFYCYWTDDPVNKVSKALSTSGLDLDTTYDVPLDKLTSSLPLRCSQAVR